MVNGVEMAVVCAEVFDTNDCFKANMVVNVPANVAEDFTTVVSEEFAIRGVHFDNQDLLIDDGEITIDFDEIKGDWSLCYVSVEL